jgi:hypothetical protein
MERSGRKRKIRNKLNPSMGVHAYKRHPFHVTISLKLLVTTPSSYLPRSGFGE